MTEVGRQRPEPGLRHRSAAPCAPLQGLGLDTGAALEHLGDEAALREYLIRFAEAYEGQAAALRNTFAAKDWENYAIGTHGLKAVFKTMGATDLGEKMFALEMAAREGRYKECERGTPEALATLADFHEKLTAALAVPAM